MSDTRTTTEPYPTRAHGPPETRSTWHRELAVLALAVTALALSARVSVPVPGSPVPQSLQTLAVVLVGASLGSLRGGLALALYLLVGAIGTPVFADGAAGAAHLVGPTSGYFVGFVVAAVLVGWGAERARAGFLRAFFLMALGHLLILALGWLRLSFQLGSLGALEAGVLPFLWGGVAKSAAGAAAWTVWHRWRVSHSTPLERGDSKVEPRLETNG
jgi:biotin transport system substrate-specific component